MFAYSKFKSGRKGRTHPPSVFESGVVRSDEVSPTGRVARSTNRGDRSAKTGDTQSGKRNPRKTRRAKTGGSPAGCWSELSRKGGLVPQGRAGQSVCPRPANRSVLKASGRRRSLTQPPARPPVGSLSAHLRSDRRLAWDARPHHVDLLIPRQPSGKKPQSTASRFDRVVSSPESRSDARACHVIVRTGRRKEEILPERQKAGFVPLKSGLSGSFRLRGPSGAGEGPSEGASQFRRFAGDAPFQSGRSSGKSAEVQCQRTSRMGGAHPVRSGGHARRAPASGDRPCNREGSCQFSRR